jgi:hypothetical protein
MASMMLGWSEPRFTKQWETPASHNASKKAKEVVYMLGGLTVDRLRCCPDARDDAVAVPTSLLRAVDLKLFPLSNCRRGGWA